MTITTCTRCHGWGVLRKGVTCPDCEGAGVKKTTTTEAA